ncbi:MAG: hypothetical protein N3G79_06925 [Sulfolobales archaeon]|nr:hypothetical protein [Sulfolobales archaeon]
MRLVEDILNEVEKRVEKIRWKDYQKRKRYIMFSIQRRRRKEMLKKSYYEEW